MDFHTMKRKELQALCKTHKIPANLTNLEMANRLASLLEVDKEKPPKQRVNSVKSCLKILDDLVDVDEKRSEDKLGKKVRFSPQDQTFEFEKTNPREMRLARRKSVVLAEDKINTGVKVNESVDVVNQVKSMRTRGRGRNPEQADVEDSKLLAKKKAEEIDGSTKTLRKRTSFVADCEVQPLVDARRHKAAKDTASEATKPVTRRSVRIVERPDESASVIEQVEIDNLPKRKTRSDWPENQEMEKAPTRCLRRNISKDACSKEVEELKEQGNGTSRVTRKTRQQKGYIGLNETVSAAESAPVEKASTRAEELKEQGNEKAKVMRKTRQQKGDIGLNETVSGAESAPVEKPSTRAEALKEQGKGKAKVTRQTCQEKGEIGLNETVSATESATVVDKDSTRCLRKNTSKDTGGKAAEEARELGNKKGRVTRTSRLQKGDIELNEIVSAMESADVVEQGQQRRSTRVAIKRCSLAPGELNVQKSDVDAQQRGVTLKSKKSRKQDNSSHPGKSDEQTRCADKRKLSTKKHGEGLQTDLEVAPLAVSSEISSVCETGDIQNRLCNESSALEDNQDNDKSLHQTTTTLLLKERELTNAEAKAELINESSTNKNAQAKQPENAVFSSNQKGVLLELYCSDGQLTEGDEDEPDINKEEKNKEAIILDGISLDDPEVVLLPSIGFQASPCGTTSTVSRSFTEGSKKELENTVSKADYHVKIDPALTSTSTDTFTGIFLLECESESQGIYEPHLETAIPSSLIVESDVEDGNSIEVSPFKNTELEEHTLRAENQSGDALEECNALDFYNLEGQISRDESTVHGLECNAVDSLGAHESANIFILAGKNMGHIEESEGVTPTPMVDERSEGIDTCISDGSDDPAECKRSHKLGLEEERDSPMTIREQTYDIASLFQLDSAELDSVVISNRLEGKNITGFSDIQLNEDLENDAVLADRNLEVYMEKAGKNEGYYQVAEGASPTATVHELSEGIETCISDRSYDPAEFEKSHKQGLKEEPTSQMAIHQETNGMIASSFQLESAERDSEETCDIALLFQLENAERDRVVTSNDLEENNVEEDSDAPMNDNNEDERFAEKKLEVNEEEGKSCSEMHEISGIVNESAVSMEEAICVGSTAMVHNVSSPPSYYSNKLELVGGLKRNEELTCIDYNDKLPAQLTSLSFKEDAFIDGAGESDPQNLTESGHLDLSESDSEISSEDESSEEQDVAITPNDCLVVPCDLEHADANNNYEITKEVSGEVACPLERYTVLESEATQDAVTPDLYSPKPNPAGLSHPMDQEEYENVYKTEAAPNVIEGSEEKLVSPSFVEEATTSDENIESDDSRGTVEAIAPFSEAVCPDDELYSIKDIEPEEDFLGLAILERISEQTGDQGSSEISGDSELHEADDDKEFEENASFTLEPEEADIKVYKEAHIHNGYSSEDSENVLLCSDRVKGSPPKESEGWTSMEKVDEIFGGFVVDSFESDRTDDYAGSEGSHKQGLTKESNLELYVHEGFHVFEDENAPTDEANKDVSVELMKQDKGLVGEILEGENGRIEPPVTASFPEMSSITPDDESKNADVKGISNEYVFGGSGQEPLIRSVVDDNPTAVNMEIDALGGSAQLLTQLPEPSYPGDEMDAPEHICEEEDVHIHGNTEKEFELTDLETDNDTSFGCGADEQNHTTSETGFTLLSSLSSASKLQEEAAIPNSHPMGMCQVELEDCDIVDQGTSFKRITLAVYNEELPQDGHDDTILPEHSRTSELVTGTREHIRDGEAPLVNLEFCIGEAEVQLCVPRLEMHGTIIDDQDKSENIEGISKADGCDKDLSKVDHEDTSIPEYSSTPLANLEFCIGEAEVQPCVPHLEMHGTMIDDQYRSENSEGISKDTEIMPEQEMKPLRDEVTANVYDKDLSKVDHEDTSIPEYSRTPELVVGTFEQLENDNALVIQPISDMVEELKEEEEAGSSEQEIKSTGKNLECSNGELEVQACELRQESSTVITYDQYKYETVEGISKDNEIMPQQGKKPLDDEVTPAVYDKNLSKHEHEDTSIPEHSITVELVSGTYEHLEDGNASMILPMSHMLEDLKEDELPRSSVEEIKSTDKNWECCNGEVEGHPYGLYPELNTTMLDDHYKSENIEGIFKEDEIMPQQEMKPLNDEITPDVYDEDLFKVEHEDPNLPEHSRTSELVNGAFEQLEVGNASVILPMSDMLEDLKEDAIPVSSEEVLPCELHPEMSTTMIDDQYKSEIVEGTSKEDEIMPQQEMKPLNDEIIPNVYDEGLSKVEHEDPNLPEHSRTSELVNGSFEQLEVGNAFVILPMSYMLEDLKEDAVPVSSEELLSFELHPELSTTIIDDQYKSENVEGTSKEDEIMPQQEMKPLNDEITPDVYDEGLSKVEHEDPNLLEHCRTSELVTGSSEQLEDGNASVIQPMSHILDDLKEDAVLVSSEEVLSCELHPELTSTIIDDQYKSENFEGISKEDEIMPQQELKPPNDEITPDVYDEDLCKVGHEDPNLPEQSRTSELVNGVFEQLEDDNPYVIQPMPDVLEDLKEDAVPVSSEEVVPCELHPELNTTMTDDQYKSENVEGTSKQDEIRDAKLEKVEKSSKKPASATNQKKRSILIHGTPRRPIKIADMKENSTAQLKRDRLANATATKPLAGRKALGELSRWRP